MKRAMGWLVVVAFAAACAPADFDTADPNARVGPRERAEGDPTAPLARAVDDREKQAPMIRECLKQDDCPDGLTCVAVTLRELRCQVYEPAPPKTGTAGRPVPPVGLLDGSAMRRQMGGAP